MKLAVAASAPDWTSEFAASISGWKCRSSTSVGTTSRSDAPGTAPGAAKLDAADIPGPTRRVALGTLFGARSGDKGGNANVGLWARRARDFEWLRGFLTIERLRELLPEAVALEVRRHEFPNLLALNFVLVGLLGDGVAASVRSDPQAKGLGEYLRSRLVELPVALLVA